MNDAPISDYTTTGNAAPAASQVPAAPRTMNMGTFFESFLPQFLLHVFQHPELVTETTALLKSVSTGEGGAGKVAAIATNLAALTSSAQQVAKDAAKATAGQ